MERAEALGLVRALPKPIKRSALLEVILETFKLGALATVEAKLPTEVELASAIKFEGLDVLLAEDNAINQKYRGTAFTAARAHCDSCFEWTGSTSLG